MYEYCDECPNIRELLRQYTEEWIERVKIYFYKKCCKINGHQFKMIKLMEHLYKNKKITRIKCKCGYSVYIFTSTGEELSKGESSEYSASLVLLYLNSSSNIYELLPKEPWSGSNES